MSGDLRSAGDDGGSAARCIFCHALAVGPCASCHRPVCGDCCELTSGGVKTWAICLSCSKRGGRSLLGPWTGLLLWLGVIIVTLGTVLSFLLISKNH